MSTISEDASSTSKFYIGDRPDKKTDNLDNKDNPSLSTSPSINNSSSTSKLETLQTVLVNNQAPITNAVLLNSKNDMFMQEFLEVARNANIENLLEMIHLGKTGKNSNAEPINFDINYRGKSKRFYGWTSLHIGCYFNLLDVVKTVTQQSECDVNICNYENDTPLHKACLTSRYEIIEFLLMKNVDINKKNNDGFKPKDLATDQAVKKLMQAAEKTQSHNQQKLFFEAVTNHDIDLINKLLINKDFDLNCLDTFGNTALHSASNRNQCEIAALLMQKGIDTVIKNHNNLTALDLAKTQEMKEILGYMPYNWRKYEGCLMKKRKFLGFKEYYVVLNKGSIIYYANKKDASKDVNRKGTYFLNNAFIGDYPSNNSDNPEYSWTVNFTNGRKHTLCSALNKKTKSSNHLSRQSSKDSNRSKISRRTHLNPNERKKKWIQALNEHIRYSESQLESQQNENKHLIPMESLQQNLNILKCGEDKLNFLVIQIEQQIGSVKLSDLSQLPPQSNLSAVFLSYKKNFESLRTQITTLIDDSNKCLSLQEQRESLLKSQLNETRNKCELLEQSLRVLAQENHEMETKKLHQKSNFNKNHKVGINSSGTMGSQNDIDLPCSSDQTRDLSTEEDIVNDGAIDDESDDGSEEFFDIADDFSDEEETDDKSNDFLGTDTNSQLSKFSKESENLNFDQNDKLKTLNILEIDVKGWRSRLPAPMIDRSQISIWSILKQSIGKELSKITLPAAWCEPVSFLQRVTENFYYSDLLNKATDPSIANDKVKRMEYICAYAVSNIAGNVDRLSKPFNPLQGETYELMREDLGFKLLCEQVSHHPPVSAFHVDSTNPERSWKFYGDINPKTKFWGKSIEIYPKGVLTLELNELNETYTWSSVTCCVHNIIVGKLWFEYYGSMEILCNQTGYKAVINFKPYSWSNKDINRFEGYIYDNKKKKMKALYGYWTHCLYSCDVAAYEAFTKTGKKAPTVEVDRFYNDKNQQQKISDDSNSNNNAQLNNDLVKASKSPLSMNSNFKLINGCEIWQAMPRPSYTDEYYCFNYFTMTLNEMKEHFEHLLPPTDCRFRTDIKELEKGNLDGAGTEKNRLEEAQRERRKFQTEDYKGTWFKLKKHPIVKEDTWQFTNQYWKRNYENCPQLY